MWAGTCTAHSTQHTAPRNMQHTHTTRTHVCRARTHANQRATRAHACAPPLACSAPTTGGKVRFRNSGGGGWEQQQRLVALGPLRSRCSPRTSRESPRPHDRVTQSVALGGPKQSAGHLPLNQHYLATGREGMRGEGWDITPIILCHHPSRCAPPLARGPAATWPRHQLFVEGGGAACRRETPTIRATRGPLSVVAKRQN